MKKDICSNIKVYDDALESIFECITS